MSFRLAQIHSLFLFILFFLLRFRSNSPLLRDGFFAECHAFDVCHLDSKLKTVFFAGSECHAFVISMFAESCRAF